jgi:hypothetical protein
MIRLLVDIGLDQQASEQSTVIGPMKEVRIQWTSSGRSSGSSARAIMFYIEAARSVRPETLNPVIFLARDIEDDERPIFNTKAA